MYNYILYCPLYTKSGHLVYCVLYVLIIQNTNNTYYVLYNRGPCLALAPPLLRGSLLLKNQKGKCQSEPSAGANYVKIVSTRSTVSSRKGSQRLATYAEPAIAWTDDLEQSSVTKFEPAAIGSTSALVPRL